MHLVTAILGFTCAGICLYNGINESSWAQLLLAAIWMAVGRVNIKRHKQDQ